MRRAATIVLILLIPPTFIGLTIAGALRHQQFRAERCRAELARVAAWYDIEIVSDDSPFPATTAHGVIYGHRPATASIVNFSPEFVREFGLYPASAIKRTKLRRVVLCEGLALAGRPAAGMTVYEHDAIYLDVNGAYDLKDCSEAIHHEMFHQIDYSHNGRIDADERWERLNPPAFRYGNGGWSALSRPDSRVLTGSYPGFLNHYSTTAVEEDKAEVYAHLVVNHAYVENATRSDPVLKAKVVRIREQVADFCPEMNDSFWRKAWATER